MNLGGHFLSSTTVECSGMHSYLSSEHTNVIDQAALQSLGNTRGIESGVVLFDFLGEIMAGIQSPGLPLTILTMRPADWNDSKGRRVTGFDNWLCCPVRRIHWKRTLD